MKIGLDLRHLLPATHGGIPYYLRRLTENLLTADPANDYFLFNNASRTNPALRTFARGQIIERHWPNKFLNYGCLKFFGRPTTTQLFYRQLDVFLLPHFNFIGLDPRTRNVAVVHDLAFLRQPEFFSPQQNLWHRNLNLGRNLNRFDQLIAVSQATKFDLMDLLKIPEAKISVIYAGCDPNLRLLNPDDQLLKTVQQKFHLPNNFILYFGSLEKRKNTLGLIQAYQNLLRRRPDLTKFKLVLAGASGWGGEKILRAIRQDTAGNLIYLGSVTDEEKLALYNLATVFAYPSFYEGFGFPVLEAMACGCPVLTAAATSLPEITGQAAILVDPYNLEQISNGLALLLDNAELRQNLRVQGLERVREFSWGKTAREYLGVLNLGK